MNLRISMVTFAAIFLIQPILNMYLPAGLRIDIDLCLVSVMALTMEHDRLVKPLAVAFAFALLEDICYNTYTGPTLLAMLSVVVLTLFARRLFNTENPIFDILFAAVSFFVYGSVYWAICRGLGAAYTYFYMLKRLPVSLAVNTAIAGVMILLTASKAAQARRDSYFK